MLLSPTSPGFGMVYSDRIQAIRRLDTPAVPVVSLATKVTVGGNAVILTIIFIDSRVISRSASFVAFDLTLVVLLYRQSVE